MIWPIGQPPGEVYALARRSRELWEAVSQEAGFFFRSSGSLHLAYDSLEADVLREFMSLYPERGSEWLDADTVIRHYPFVQQGCVGAMHSLTEACVDPREAVHALAAELILRGADIRFSTPVQKIEPHRVELAGGEVLEGDWVIAATGPDLWELMPGRHQDYGLKRCRLHMMRYAPRFPGPRLGVHLCAGLTLSHYAGFRDCPSLPKLRDVQEKRWERQTRFGIHVLVSEHGDGSITVGDSHEYGLTFRPYRAADIDEAIEEATRQFLDLSNYQLIERWEGIYNTHDHRTYIHDVVEDGLLLVNVFGTGMTLSFGLAEQSQGLLS
jgi:FAD dependent oxidoreductase TIGR03364